MAINPYLFFSGNCREAFTQYKEIFGGELTLLPFTDLPPGESRPEGVNPDLIMHAALVFGDNLLMASDDPTGDGGPVIGMSVSYSTDEVSEVERVFDSLADGGKITMPLETTFWSPKYGMCIDRFGIPWMVAGERPPDVLTTEMASQGRGSAIIMVASAL